MATSPDESRPIPPPAASTIQKLFMQQSSHLDWDWMITFKELYAQPHQPQTLYAATPYFSNPYPVAPYVYYNQPASYIFKIAAGMLAANNGYSYSICEMGFLQAFCNDPTYAAEVAQLKTAATNGSFRILGGGITSPDNLLPHGEAFIRNFLTGKAFVHETFGIQPAPQCWLPDDFGHDSQLPVILRAMGMQGVGFSRVPGDGVYGGTPIDSSLQSVADALYASGVDFVWRASDGSTVIAHWMLNTYCQGDGIMNVGVSQGTQSTIDWINSYIATDTTGPNQQSITQNTPYLFLPVGCDFRTAQPLAVSRDGMERTVFVGDRSGRRVVRRLHRGRRTAQRVASDASDGRDAVPQRRVRDAAREQTAALVRDDGAPRRRGARPIRAGSAQRDGMRSRVGAGSPQHAP